MVLAKREKRGEKHGMERRSCEIVINMLRKNLPDEMIADFAGVSLKYIQEVKKSSCTKMN